MKNEVSSFILNGALTEIHNICPDIRNSFLFTEDGEIVARDENTPENTAVQVVDAFDGILEKASTLGSVNCMSLETTRGRATIDRVGGFYIVTVASRDADKKYIEAVTRVLIPTILKALEKIDPAPIPNGQPEQETIVRPPRFDEAQKPPITSEEAPEVKPDLILPEPPVTQFIVENLGGLLVPTDTVRIDNNLLMQWQETYQDRIIEEVEVETFGGKATQCRVKPIKDSKYEGKGIIQIPEKIQNALEIKKGELVKIKPVIQ